MLSLGGMKQISILLIALALLAGSCKSVNNIFSKKTPHEKYAEQLEDKALDITPEGKAWLSLANKALTNACPVKLPYQQNGFFHADKPHALGLKFTASLGEKITFNLQKNTTGPYVIYADVYKQEVTTIHLFSADTSSAQFSFNVEESGTYFLRLQPQLYHHGEYKLTVNVSPSLGFPVLGNKATIGSFWGADRDGGKRSHEGIDIFAPKLTPAIAASPGTITGVQEGGIGGKTVWLKVNNSNTYLYYAHLDEQLVQQGQTVDEGEVLGLVGNTGNARFTPSHLHFGVYTTGGAVDPLPFVSLQIKPPQTAPAKSLLAYLQLIKPQKLTDGTIVAANTELVPLAVNAKGYLAEMPDGNIIQAGFDVVKVSKQKVPKQAAQLVRNNRS